MKIPDKIYNLTMLAKWVDKYNPKILEIGVNSKLREIRDFNPGQWRFYRNIKIKYSKK